MTDNLEPLKGHDNWVEWGHEAGDTEKRPYTPDGRPTGHSPGREGEWVGYDETGEQRGFVLTGTPFWAADIDHCEVDGEELVCTVEDDDHQCRDLRFAEKLMEALRGRTYWETSPSGEGYHMLAEDEDADNWAYKGEHVEIYTTRRYVTVTGDEAREASAPVSHVSISSAKQWAKEHGATSRTQGGDDSETREAPEGGNDLTNEEVVEKILDSEQAEKFDRLYHQGDLRGYGGDHSKADLALLSILAFWTGGDEEQMDRLFQGSALCRDKWTDRADYRETTMERAIDSCDGFYGVSDWGTVRWMFGDDDVSAQRARSEVYDVLTGEHHFLAMKDTEELYRYDPETGIYLPDGEQFVSAVLERELNGFYSRHTRNEIVDRVKAANWTERDDVGASPEDPKLCVENGVLDLESVELSGHSPGERFIRRLPVEYDPGAENPEVGSFLDDVTANEEDKRLVYEVFGQCLFPGQVKDSIVIAYGDGRNGKTVLFDLLQELLGPENTSNNTLQDLAEDDFAIADLYGKMANICGDLPADEVRDSGLIKQLSGGDRVRANPKHESPFYFKNEAQLVFAANAPPKIDDDTTAMARRLVPLNMPVEFTPEGQAGPDQVPRHELMERLTTEGELSGTLNEAIEGLHRLIENGEWTGRDSNIRLIRNHYAKISDPVYAFVEECIRETADPGDYVPTQELFSTYYAWARDNSAPLKDQSVLGKEIPRHAGMASKERKRIGGSRKSVYTSIELTDRGRGYHPHMGEADNSEGQASL